MKADDFLFVLGELSAGELAMSGAYRGRLAAWYRDRVGSSAGSLLAGWGARSGAPDRDWAAAVRLWTGEAPPPLNSREPPAQPEEERWLALLRASAWHRQLVARAFGRRVLVRPALLTAVMSRLRATEPDVYLARRKLIERAVRAAKGEQRLGLLGDWSGHALGELAEAAVPGRVLTAPERPRSAEAVRRLRAGG